MKGSIGAQAQAGTPRHGPMHRPLQAQTGTAAAGRRRRKGGVGGVNNLRRHRITDNNQDSKGAS